MIPSTTFLLLCGTGVLCFLSYNLVRMPVLSLFAQSLGAGPETIGLVVSLSTLTGVFLKLPSGALSDIYGRRMLMRIGVVAFGLPPFLYPFITNLDALMMLRLTHGLATAIFAPTALATVAELYPTTRGAALGWYTASTQAGSLLGPVIGGWLVYSAGFSTTFVTSGIVGCIGILLFYLLHLNPPPPRERRDRGIVVVVGEMWKGFQIVAKNRRVLITSLADAAKMIANGALMAFLPIYGLTIGLNPGQVGLLFGVQGVTSFLSKPVMGRVSDRVGRRPLILIGLLICAGMFGLMPYVSGIVALLLLSSGFGFGEAVVSSSTAAFVADSSEFKRLGAGLGMQGTIMDIGHASGPLLAGVLIGQFSYAGAFGAIGGLQLIAAITFYLSTRDAHPTSA